MRRFGDYELLEEIARGGMGIVYKARQVSLDRIVALKMILAGQLASTEDVARFRAEAQTAAGLQHPNIVAIHEVGEHEKQQYFSMDYVEGTDLAHLLRAGPLPAHSAARYLKTIAEAVQFAHEHGVVHRDLKPSNILIDNLDQPRITDFGLAKKSNADLSLTVTGQVLGTPSFMAPEQTTNRRGEVGVHSDIYSLGAILYHMLLGRPPFVADSIATLLRLVCESEPISPRNLNPSLPKDLETICLKCLQKDPNKRFGTAAELAEELGRFLRIEPIRSRPVSGLERIWRWCVRNPVLTIWIILSVLILCVGFAGVLWQWRRAVQNEHVAKHNLYSADMNLAQQAVAENNFGRAKALLERHRPSKKSGTLFRKAEDVRGWEWRYIWELLRSDEMTVLGPFSNGISGLAFSPDGQRLAFTGDRQLHLWDLKAKREIGVFNDTNLLIDAKFSPDGKWISCSGFGTTALLLDTATLEKIASFPRTSGLIFSRDSRSLWTRTETAIKCWAVPSGSLISRKSFKTGFKPSAVNVQETFSSEGRWYAAGAADEGARVWDIQSGMLKMVLPREGLGLVYRLAFSPDASVLAVGYMNSVVKLWSVPDGTLLHTLAGSKSWTTVISFSPDGKTLASGGYDHVIDLWDVPSGSRRATLRGHERGISQIAFSPDSTQLASTSLDRTIRFWHNERRIRAGASVNFPSLAKWIELSPNGSHALVRTIDNELLLYETSDLQQIAREAIDPQVPVGHAVTSGGSLVALGATNGFIEIRRCENGKFVQAGVLQERVHIGSTILAFSSTGKLLTSADQSGQVLVWDIDARRVVAEFKHAAEYELGKLSFGLDDRQVAFGWGAMDREKLALWDLVTRRPIAVLPGRGTGPVVSHNGKMLATGSFGQGSSVWEFSKRGSLREIAALTGNVMPAETVAFSTDDTRLAVGLGSGEIRIWDIQNKQEVALLHGHSLPIWGLHFTADSKRLISASPEGMHVWKAASFAETDRAEH